MGLKNNRMLKKISIFFYIFTRNFDWYGISVGNPNSINYFIIQRSQLVGCKNTFILK